MWRLLCSGLWWPVGELEWAVNNWKLENTTPFPPVLKPTLWCSFPANITEKTVSINHGPPDEDGRITTGDGGGCRGRITSKCVGGWWGHQRRVIIKQNYDGGHEEKGKTSLKCFFLPFFNPSAPHPSPTNTIRSWAPIIPTLNWTGARFIFYPTPP